MRVGCAGEAVSSNLTPLIDTVPHQEFVARSAVYGGPTEFHAVLCRLRGQHRRRRAATVGDGVGVGSAAEAALESLGWPVVAAGVCVAVAVAVGV